MRRALGLHRLSRHGLGWGCVACPRCAYARADWLGLHLRRLHHCTTAPLHHCALCQRHNRSPVRRVRCQHTKVAVAMRARGWHQGCNALDQLQWRECDFIDLCAPLVVGFADRLASGDLGRRFQPSIVHASTASPGTRWNSRALLVMTTLSSARAWAAIITSMPPMSVPARSRAARMWA